MRGRAARGRPSSEVCVCGGEAGPRGVAGQGGAQSIPESSALQVQIRSTGHKPEPDGGPPSSPPSSPGLHLRVPTTQQRALTGRHHRDGWCLLPALQPQGSRTQAVRSDQRPPRERAWGLGQSPPGSQHHPHPLSSGQPSGGRGDGLLGRKAVDSRTQSRWARKLPPRQAGHRETFPSTPGRDRGEARTGGDCL